MKKFGGNALFLDRKDINTDEIIPAKYLTEITKEALEPYLLEDLKLTGFDTKRDINGKAVIISRENFGCGSSREHAPWAFEVNGIYIVIATSFARIFRQNMFNCGMIAIEMNTDIIDLLFEKYKGKEVSIQLELNKKELTFDLEGEKETFNFFISEYDEALVKAGGWVNYADLNY